METTSVAVAVRLRLPLTPVTVHTLEPAGAVVATVTVSVEEFAVAGFGLKVPLTPVPRPLTDNVTGPVNPSVLLSLHRVTTNLPIALVSRGPRRKRGSS